MTALRSRSSLKATWALCLVAASLATHVRAFVLPTSSPSSSTSMFSTSTSKSATGTTSGTSIGHSEVDMNQYNLETDQIVEEWTANLQAATAMQEAGCYLGAKTSKYNFVDTLKVALMLPPPGEGLGIELLELAGGRGDGLGITMVSGLVPGKTAASSELLYGDSIIGLSLRERTTHNRGQEQQTMEELFSADIECRDYDGTIEGILDMVAKTTEVQEERPDAKLFYVLTIKRLRRKPKINLLLQYPPSQGEPDIKLELFAGENLRRAMLGRGVKLNDPLSRRFDSGGSGDCGAEGTCATCAVNVVKGTGLFNGKGDQEAKILEKNPRWRFACRAIVGYGMQEGDMVIRVNPRQWDE